MEITSKSEWGKVDWRKVESAVSKLQRRIYRASESENWVLVGKLQKLLVKSQSAKLLAVRKVTQENKGKNTAGIDGVKNLNPQQRLCLAEELTLDGKSKPVRRIWIPKPGRKEKRGLGIPTIEERAKQALLKLVLEPEWEAKFEPNSYGFRPGRSCHDAIEAIRIAIQYKPKFVLDADIEKCFDNIDHNKLVNKASNVKAFRRQIGAWLKSGVIEDKKLSPTDKGTPQGGVISPLLANIALHGMENAIAQAFPSTKARVIRKSKEKYGYLIQKPTLVRYADDFVVVCEDLRVIQECMEVLRGWLGEWGLNLKEEKTRITHTLLEYEGQKPGFDILGANIRQYPRGKKHSGHIANKDGKRILGYKTFIKPSETSIRSHYKDLADTISKLNGASQETVIQALKTKITGWCNYYKPWNSKETFTTLSHLIWKRLWRWGVRRHCDKGAEWVMGRYFHTIKGRKWTFAVKTDRDDYITLSLHDQYKAGARHKKVKDKKSPYDGDTNYWCTRLGEQYKTTDPQKARLFKRQKGKCDHCEATFQSNDLVEKHHIVRRADGGKNNDKNIVLLHLHCHDKVHRNHKEDVVTNRW